MVSPSISSKFSADLFTDRCSGLADSSGEDHDSWARHGFEPPRRSAKLFAPFCHFLRPFAAPRGCWWTVVSQLPLQLRKLRLGTEAARQGCGCRGLRVGLDRSCAEGFLCTACPWLAAPMDPAKPNPFANTRPAQSQYARQPGSWLGRSRSLRRRVRSKKGQYLDLMSDDLPVPADCRAEVGAQRGSGGSLDDGGGLGVPNLQGLENAR
jgi:hypothetical protein